MKIALFAEGDHLFNQRTNCLGLGHGGLHPVFDEDGSNQVAQQRAAMAGIASELESCIAMAHGCYSLSVIGVRDQGSGVSKKLRSAYSSTDP